MGTDLGLAVDVQLESFGDPGYRTFRLTVMGRDLTTAALWLEKEHVRGLGLALLEMLPEAAEAWTGEAGHELNAGRTTIEFRVGRMGLGWNAAERTLVMQAEDETEADSGSPALIVQFSEEHCRYLVRQAERIVSAGRPLCPLCTAPMDASGHVCVRLNGHKEGSLLDLEDEK